MQDPGPKLGRAPGLLVLSATSSRMRTSACSRLEGATLDEEQVRQLGSPSTREKVVTSLARPTVAMSELAGLLAATSASSSIVFGSSNSPGGFIPNGEEPKNV